MKYKLLEGKLKKMFEGVTFDDILLLPGYTDFKRKDVELTVKLHKKITLKLPIISSPMDTVTEDKMAIEIAQNGGLGIIHRNLSIEKQVEMINKTKKTKVNDLNKAAIDEKKRLLVGAAVGIGEDFEKRTKKLIENNVDLIVIDSGHGNTKFMIEGVKFIKKNYPKIPVMAGNIATYEGARNLIKAGADILRVGMGPGSICTTRIISGMGVPQLTAIVESVKAADNKIPVIADGGIKQFGDIAKALAFGASAVMLGSLLAGVDEAPGNLIVVNGKKYKEYRGMGSIKAMKKGSAERYGQTKTTKKLIAEGVEGIVEYKGKLADHLYQIEGSLKSAFYYIGGKNIKEFFEKSNFIKISRAGLLESHPHSIVITNSGENYKL